MKSVRWLLLGALSVGFAWGADPKWITMQNENFRMYSSANANSTRDAMNYFERIRSFFLQRVGAPPEKPVPIVIVLFNSAKEYEPYRLNEFATAYYTGYTDRDYIVMGQTGEEAARVAAHEYTHLVFKHAGSHLPPWLSEGIAELFSTLRPAGGDTEYGDAIPGRLFGLSQQAWVPLRVILAADQGSPYYNEKQRAGSLYNESWALVQFLSTTEEYRAKFWDVVKAVDAGMPSVEAMEKTYGRPLEKIETELQFHIKSGNFRKLIVKGVRVTDIGKLPAEPADLYTVRVVQADLLAGFERSRPEARKRYEDLVREDAKRPEPRSALGYLAWRENNLDDAMANFTKAYELGTRDDRFLWDYGRLAERSNPDTAVTVLSELIQMQPENVDAHTELGLLRMMQRKPSEALVAIRGITKVKNVEQAERLLYVTASADVQLGNYVEGKARAEELKRKAKSEEYIRRADILLSFLNQAEQNLTRGEAAPQAVAVTREELVAPPGDTPDQDSSRPVLQRRETSSTATPDLDTSLLQEARGTLVELACGDSLQMVLQMDQERKTFLVQDPNRMVVTGREGGITLECGPQKKPEAVLLQFMNAPVGSTAAGLVRALHFGQ